MQACSSAFMGAAMPARLSMRTTSDRGALCVRANTFEAGVGLMGNKAGMTQIFTEAGVSVPVTVIALGDGNVVTQVRPDLRQHSQAWGRDGLGAYVIENQAT
eukprot:6410380-Pyramimonas_sp.AAC.1